MLNRVRWGEVSSTYKPYGDSASRSLCKGSKLNYRICTLVPQRTCRAIKNYSLDCSFCPFGEIRTMLFGVMMFTNDVGQKMKFGSWFWSIFVDFAVGQHLVCICSWFVLLWKPDKLVRQSFSRKFWSKTGSKAKQKLYIGFSTSVSRTSQCKVYKRKWEARNAFDRKHSECFEKKCFHKNFPLRKQWGAR